MVLLTNYWLQRVSCKLHVFQRGIWLILRTKFKCQRDLKYQFRLTSFGFKLEHACDNPLKVLTREFVSFINIDTSQDQLIRIWLHFPIQLILMLLHVLLQQHFVVLHFVQRLSCPLIFQTLLCTHRLISLRESRLIHQGWVQTYHWKLFLQVRVTLLDFKSCPQFLQLSFEYQQLE